MVLYCEFVKTAGFGVEFQCYDQGKIIDHIVMQYNNQCVKVLIKLNFFSFSKEFFTEKNVFFTQNLLNFFLCLHVGKSQTEKRQNYQKKVFSSTRLINFSTSLVELDVPL
jgi:hypothetical protein